MVLRVNDNSQLCKLPGKEGVGWGMIHAKVGSD